MDEQPEQLELLGTPPPVTERARGGRPRKWASEEERRAHEHAKREARRAAARAERAEKQANTAHTEPAAPRKRAARTRRRTRPEPAAAHPTRTEKARDARLDALREPAPLNVRDPDLIALATTAVPGFPFGLPNVAEAFQYARDVLDAIVPACLDVRQACERHERDQVRSDTDPTFPYVFHAGKAERALGAMQLFREIKGARAGQMLRLSPWQRFIYASLFGWVDRDSLMRRFRYGFVAVPRGNGKSTGAAPVALYMLALDEEGGAEVYSAAVTRDQAGIVFKTAQEMARRDSVFRYRYGVAVPAHAITQEGSASIMRALSRDADALDGLNVHFCVLDELAKHKTREVHDVLITATGKRAQPLILAITTAASNQAGIGFEQWRYTRRVLRGEIKDESYFGIIYTIDEGDDWREPASWRKANPNWNVSVNPEHIADLANRAQRNANQQNAFKQKHLNLWTHAAVAWMDLIKWNACADPKLSEKDFKGEACVLGLDLAAKVDLAARVKVFERIIDEVAHYYVFAHFYLPQAAIDEGKNASYAGWVADGFITACPGETTDFDRIMLDVLDDAEQHRIDDVAYDPWQALNLASDLAAKGIPVIEYRPTVANFSPAMKDLDALVREGRLHHTGNPVLDWHVACVEVFEDAKGNIYPRKDRNDPNQKIDGVIAMLSAYGRRMTLDATEKTPSLSFL